MLRNIVRLVILGLIVHAGVRVVPEFWHYLQFRDAVTEVASYPGRKTPEQLRDRIVQLAQQHNVPVGPQDVTVTRAGARTTVFTGWTAQLEYVPYRFYEYDFIVDVEGRPERFNGF